MFSTPVGSTEIPPDAGIFMFTGDGSVSQGFPGSVLLIGLDLQSGVPGLKFSEVVFRFSYNGAVEIDTVANVNHPTSTPWSAMNIPGGSTFNVVLDAKIGSAKIGDNLFNGFSTTALNTATALIQINPGNNANLNGFNGSTFTVQGFVNPTVVPEPGVFALLSVTLLGGGLLLWQRRRARLNRA